MNLTHRQLVRYTILDGLRLRVGGVKTREERQRDRRGDCSAFSARPTILCDERAIESTASKHLNVNS